MTQEIPDHEPAPPTIRKRTPPAAHVHPTNAPSDYEVGKGKPPRHTQFQKGRSGNPNGRPKGAKGARTIARLALAEKVTVQMPNGRSKRISKLDFAVRKIVEKACKGDLRAFDAVLALAGEDSSTAMIGGENDNPPAPLSEADQEILRRFAERAVAEHQNAGGSRHE